MWQTLAAEGFNGACAGALLNSWGKVPKKKLVGGESHFLQAAGNKDVILNQKPGKIMLLGKAIFTPKSNSGRNKHIALRGCTSNSEKLYPNIRMFPKGVWISKWVVFTSMLNVNLRSWSSQNDESPYPWVYKPFFSHKSWCFWHRSNGTMQLIKTQFPGVPYPLQVESPLPSTLGWLIAWKSASSNDVCRLDLWPLEYVCKNVYMHPLQVVKINISVLFAVCFTAHTM